MREDFMVDKTKIDVGTGFVILEASMGSAVSIVNAARVSMGKKVEQITEPDRRLLRYLWEHEHTSPFRHVQLQFHIKAPVFVLRQWMKHQVGCAWNEISGRYVTFNQEAWTPDVWRSQSPVIKQGSGADLEDGSDAAELYASAMRNSFNAYEALLALGVAKEQARLVLPLSLMSECYWTASLQAVIHFLRLRQDGHAQAEIRLFADAVRELVKQVDGLDLVLSICLD
jgi:thymidylate synthase (FAD)